MAMFGKKNEKEPAEDSQSSGKGPQPDEKKGGIKPGLEAIEFIVAIASGKGGVGKSTVTANLAVALENRGMRVGLLDADIYGASQPGMLGAGFDQPAIKGGQIVPLKRHGVSFISMGSLLGGEGPVVWRAPIAMKIIHQFLGNVLWGELDCLLIDLPPGTGDVQLTLAQQASLTGAIIVTTPQEIALGVARKGLMMFEQVNVPILGVIENMGAFVCKHCGKETAIFGEGGGRMMATKFDVPFLGSIPLDPEIMKSGEDGLPILRSSPDSTAAKAYLNLAENITKVLKAGETSGRVAEPKSFQLLSDNELQVEWPDGHIGRHTAYHLRLNCSCASCRDEDTGQKTLDPASVPLDIKFTGVTRVGRYALAPGFSDGHSTGIFLYQRLRELCECPLCSRDKEEETSFEV
jgi:ATP-binding protein involved in chromosome partitioning